MTNKFLVPPGFKDSVNFDTFVEHQYKNSIINSFIDNGFSLIKTPLVEYSHNLDKNTLTLKTNKKKEKLSIRNDITPQIKRIASSRLAKKNRPLKLCYYGEVVRKNGSILRPERQFQQIGAEIIGSESYKADVEIINLAYETLKKIGVKKIVIEISATFFLDKLIKELRQTRIKNQLKEYIGKKDLKNCIKLLDNQNLINNFKKIYACSGLLKTKKNQISKLAFDLDFDSEIRRLLKISDLLKVSNDDLINIDLFEIQKEKYYQGIKFTFFAKGIRGEIARGGRYTLKYENNTEAAIGYSCYMDTILRASSFESNNKKILIPFHTSVRDKNLLIKKGYSIFKSFDGRSNIREQSKSFGFDYYLYKNRVKKV